MLSKEDLQLLSDLMDKKLSPINERLDQMQDDISELKEDVKILKEDVEILKEDMEDATGKINMISEWCEAATEYHIREIHYPLNEDEKVR